MTEELNQLLKNLRLGKIAETLEQQLGRLEEALEAYREAAQLQPENRALWRRW